MLMQTSKISEYETLEVGLNILFRLTLFHRDSKSQHTAHLSGDKLITILMYCRERKLEYLVIHKSRSSNCISLGYGAFGEIL